MKRLLLATSSLALFGTGAYAEVSISGTAGFGVYYNSELPEFVAKHKFIHEVNVDFKVSGTTDGGLTFGGTAGFETNLDVMDLGTVYVGGDFGTLTIGDNDAADVIAGGIADVGLEGIGVDDVAEDIRGTSAAAIRYDNSFGQVSFAISAGSADGTPEMAGSAAEAAVPARPGHYGYTLGVARGIRQANDVFVATQSNTYTMTTTQFDAFFDANQKIANIAGWKRTGETTDDSLGISTVNANGEDEAVRDTPAARAAVPTFDAYVKWFNLGDDGVVSTGDSSDDSAKPVEADVTYVAADPGKDAVKAGAPTPATGPDNQYAFGMKFDVGNGMSLGVGYDSGKAVSLGVGYAIADVKGNLFYVTDEDDEAQKSAIGGKDFTTKRTGMGMDLSYTMGPSTMTLVFSKMSIDNLAEYGTDAASQKLVSGSVNSYGINIAHLLGGGAQFIAGFGSVPTSGLGKVTADNKLDTSSANIAAVGIGFAF